MRNGPGIRFPLEPAPAVTRYRLLNMGHFHRTKRYHMPWTKTNKWPPFSPGLAASGRAYMISNPTAAALFALGLFLTMGGIGLALFYGTLFYLVAGLLFMLTVYLLYHRQMPAPRLYAGFVLFALLWAVFGGGL
jgi:hypothetical protein